MRGEKLMRTRNSRLADSRDQVLISSIPGLNIRGEKMEVNVNVFMLTNSSSTSMGS